MSPRVITRGAEGGAAPPAAPPLDGAPVDEGPMRRELLRQIAALDAELGRLRTGPRADATSPRRGPAILSTAELETIRDELLRALGRR